MTNTKPVDAIRAAVDNSETNRIWNDYVDSSADAGFYHRFEWKRVMESEFGHKTFYLASYNPNQIDGILPLVLIQSRIFGRILCSLPFLNYCGPSASDAIVTQQLLEKGYEFAHGESADYLEIRGLEISDHALPTSTTKVSLVVALAKDSEILWDSFSRKHRKNIRRVYKSELRVEHGHADFLDTFYQVMSRSWRAHGTPIYRKRFFKAILDAFPDKTRIFVIYKGDEAIATAFCGYDKKTVEGMWAGEVPEFRSVNSNYVLYWEMIKHACESGFDTFHLGRSSAESGSEEFKRKWGADVRQLYWQYYLPAGGCIPQLNVNNPRYSRAIAVWKKMPLWATQVLGPILARSIP